MTLFLGFSFQLATRIWDLFLYYGFDILIALSIALMKLFEDRIIRLEYEACMEFLSRLPDAQIDEAKLIEITMRIWGRLVPSQEQHWREQEEMTCHPNGFLVLEAEGDGKRRISRKASAFYKLRLAYGLIKKEEAAAKAAKK